MSRENRACRGCGLIFTPNIRSQLYCHRESCDRQRQKKPISRSCPTCGRTFSTVHARQIYCNSRCRPSQPKKVIQHKKSKSRPALPQGKYVYAWFKDDDVLPFYIGQGTGKRAWMRHKNTHLTARCQQEKESSDTIRVEIIKDKLTDKGASFLESALISFLANTCRCPMSNQRIPTKYRPPKIITLEELADSLSTCA
jgi:hypothetical protein